MTPASLRHFVEKVFASMGIMLFAGAMVDHLREARSLTASAATEGDPVRMLLFSGLALVSGILVVVRFRQSARSIDRRSVVWVLVLMAYISIVWSDNPSESLKKSIAFTFITTFAIYLAATFTRRELLQILSWVCATSIVGSLVLLVLAPSWALMQDVYAGALRGVYINKNGLGRVSALGGFVFLLLALETRRNMLARLKHSTLFLLSLAVLIMANSATSKVAFLLGVSLVLLAHLQIRSPRVFKSLMLIGLFGGVALLATIVFVVQIEAVVALIGRDITLSGRTLLWVEVFEAIKARPVLGYGYGAFWLGMDGASALVLDALRWLWVPSHAHNGFMDMVLELGLVGLIVFLTGFAVVYRDSYRQLRVEKTIVAAWPAVFLSVMVLYNLVENALMRYSGAPSIFWIGFVVIALALPRWITTYTPGLKRR